MKALAADPGFTSFDRGSLSLLVLAKDSPDVVAFIAELVEDVRVTRVAGAEEAWILFNQHAPDLVVVDQDLQMESERLLERLVEGGAFNKVPVLSLISHADAEFRKSFLKIGLQDYVLKPFLPEELLLRARNLVNAKRTRESLVQLSQQVQERVAHLTESENNFRLMVDSIEDYAMFMVDLEGRITSWNRGAERLTGYSESEALGQYFSILYPHEDLDSSHAIYELAMAKKNGRYEEDGKRVRKDGSIYHAQIIMWRVDDEQGNTVGFAKITRDITARRQAEQALRESEAKFRTIADALPQMVWSTLPNGDHDYFNQQWYQFTGVPEGATDGKGWVELFHPEDRTSAQRTWQHSLATGELYEIQYRLRHHSGEYRWTLGRALPVRNDDGVIVRWMGTCTDIHQQKQTEEALQDASRRKDEFLAMLAHELRNPLAPVLTGAAVIRKLAPAETHTAQALDVIERQVRHMTRLIDDLLDVARISRGKIQLRKESCELGEILQHAVDDYRSSFDSARVSLQFPRPVGRFWIDGDRTRLMQIMGNLLHNALKFTKAGGHVEVTLARSKTAAGDVATVAVKDSGIGIDPSLAPHLFNPFTQANQDLARSNGGLGLGLALVKGFVELHGGTVNLTSAGLAQGATFTLELPLVAAGAQQITADRMTDEASHLRIVLIDDNKDMTDTLKTLLTFNGHDVFTAYDGNAGLETIYATRPDLVICDIGLPGAKNGYAVASTVRADPALASVFLVALSGYGQDHDRYAALKSGFDLHLLKPVDFGELDKALMAASHSAHSKNSHSEN